jgi:hypothetical protein
VTHAKTSAPPRDNRTITVDFQNETTYFQLLGNGKAFVEFVMAFRFCREFYCRKAKWVRLAQTVMVG